MLSFIYCTSDTLVCTVLNSIPSPPERSEREEAQAQLATLQEDYRLLETELEEAAGKVERLTDECQERSDQANQWYKTLQVLHRSDVLRMCINVSETMF